MTYDGGEHPNDTTQLEYWKARALAAEKMDRHEGDAYIAELNKGVIAVQDAVAAELRTSDAPLRAGDLKARTCKGCGGEHPTEKVAGLGALNGCWHLACIRAAKASAPRPGEDQQFVHGWELKRGQDVVFCPKCAFGMHADCSTPSPLGTGPDSYECPVCERASEAVPSGYIAEGQVTELLNELRELRAAERRSKAGSHEDAKSTVEQLCSLVARVHQTLHPSWDVPGDCFCGRSLLRSYHPADDALAFIETAVSEALGRRERGSANVSPVDTVREELTFIVSYLAHNDQDANHAWMVRRIRAVLAGKDPSTVEPWNQYDGVRPRSEAASSERRVEHGSTSHPATAICPQCPEPRSTDAQPDWHALWKATIEDNQRFELVGGEIAAWLNGLEGILQRDIASGRFPDLTSRRGIYEGIADDIKRKWPRLFP